MDSSRWNNFVAILATVSHISREIHNKPIGNYPAVCDLIDKDAPYDGWSLTLVSRAVAEIEALRNALTYQTELRQQALDALEEVESALADAGIARCEGEGCGRYVRMVLMRNGMCDDCADTEDEIDRIFGNQRAEDEAGYNEIVRAGLRWSR